MKAVEHYQVDEVTQRLSKNAVGTRGIEFAQEVDTLIKDLAMKYETTPAHIANMLSHYTLHYTRV